MKLTLLEMTTKVQKGLMQFPSRNYSNCLAYNWEQVQVKLTLLEMTTKVQKGLMQFPSGSELLFSHETVFSSHNISA